MSLNTTVSSIISKVFDNTLVGGLTLSKTATYTTQTQGSYAPLTGAITNSTSNQTVNIIEKDYSASEVSDSNGLVLDSDKKVLMSPLSGVNISASVNDKVSIDSRDYKIMNVKNVQLGSTNLLWELQCR